MATNPAPDTSNSTYSSPRTLNKLELFHTYSTMIIIFVNNLLWIEALKGVILTNSDGKINPLPSFILRGVNVTVIVGMPIHA